jgi:hypothetical protein
VLRITLTSVSAVDVKGTVIAVLVSDANFRRYDPQLELLWFVRQQTLVVKDLRTANGDEVAILGFTTPNDPVDDRFVDVEGGVTTHGLGHGWGGGQGSGTCGRGPVLRWWRTAATIVRSGACGGLDVAYNKKDFDAQADELIASVRFTTAGTKWLASQRNRRARAAPAVTAIDANTTKKLGDGWTVTAGAGTCTHAREACIPRECTFEKGAIKRALACDVTRDGAGWVMERAVTLCDPKLQSCVSDEEAQRTFLDPRARVVPVETYADLSK